MTNHGLKNVLLNKLIDREVRICYRDTGTKSKYISGTVDEVTDDNYVTITKESGSSEHVDINRITSIEKIQRIKVL